MVILKQKCGFRYSSPKALFLEYVDWLTLLLNNWGSHAISLKLSIWFIECFYYRLYQKWILTSDKHILSLTLLIDGVLYTNFRQTFIDLNDEVSTQHSYKVINQQHSILFRLNEIFFTSETCIIDLLDGRIWLLFEIRYIFWTSKSSFWCDRSTIEMLMFGFCYRYDLWGKDVCLWWLGLL